MLLARVFGANSPSQTQQRVAGTTALGQSEHHSDIFPDNHVVMVRTTAVTAGVLY